MTLASQHEHSASPDVRATCIWTPLCITNLHQALKVKSKWTQMWFLLLYKVQQNVPRACCHAGWMKLPLRGYLGSFSVLCDLRSFLFYMQSKDIRIWLCLLPGLKLLNTTTIIYWDATQQHKDNHDHVWEIQCFFLYIYPWKTDVLASPRPRGEKQTFTNQIPCWEKLDSTQ